MVDLLISLLVLTHCFCFLLYLAEDVVHYSLNPIKEKNENSGTFHFSHLLSEAERQHFNYFLACFRTKTGNACVGVGTP